MRLWNNNWLKRVKKQLRAKKRWTSLAALLIVSTLLYNPGVSKHPVKEAVVTVLSNAAAARTQSEQPEQAGQRRMSRVEALDIITSSDYPWNVTVKRNYVSGEETEELGPMNKKEILTFAGLHPEYTLDLAASGDVWFTTDIDDLSPTCKENAYIGIDKSGTLKLFNGTPEEDRVIQTFFQMNIGELKSSLPEEVWNQLNAGIRVSDKDEYYSVLSTLSSFAAGKDSSSSKQ